MTECTWAATRIIKQYRQYNQCMIIDTLAEGRILRQYKQCMTKDIWVACRIIRQYRQHRQYK